MTNEVKITKTDIETLNAVYGINQSLKIVAGASDIRCFNTNKTCAVVGKLSSPLPRTLCIYDLREFLSVIGLFQNPVLDFTNEKYVTVKSEDGKQKLKYYDAEESMIGSHFEKMITLPSVDIVLEVSGSQLANITKAAQTLKLAFIGFKSVDGVIQMYAFDKNDGDNRETNTFSVDVGETQADFNLFYKTEVLAVLSGDCKFELSSKRISKVECSDRVYFITMDKDSSFN